MRLTDVLGYTRVKNLLVRTEENVPFKPRLGLKIRNKVSGKGDGVKRAVCLQEMFDLFSCMKRHDFLQSPCGKEIIKFQKCAETQKAEAFQRKSDAQAGILTPGAARLTAGQLNLLLKQFKQ